MMAQIREILEEIGGVSECLTARKISSFEPVAGLRQDIEHPLDDPVLVHQVLSRFHESHPPRGVQRLELT